MTQLTVTIQDSSKVSAIRKLLQKFEGVTVSITQFHKKEDIDEKLSKKEIITPFVASLGIKPSRPIDDKDEEDIIYEYLSEKYK